MVARSFVHATRLGVLHAWPILIRGAVPVCRRHARGLPSGLDHPVRGQQEPARVVTLIHSRSRSLRHRSEDLDLAIEMTLKPTRTKALDSLLSDVDGAVIHGDPSDQISAITHDSRAVAPGALFVAYQGVNQDVHAYLPDAFARGATAAIVERPVAELQAEYDLPAGACLVVVPDARLARAHVAAALYDHPSRALHVVGVTGTDGKTTTSTLIDAILRAAGMRVGLVSTVAARIGDTALDTGLHVTTPEPEDLQRYLAMMRDEGAEAAVVEVTSHGLAQHRAAAVAFDVGVLTNITHEAIEYHGSFDAYRDAKAMLFWALEEADERHPDDEPTLQPTAVLNMDDPSGVAFLEIPTERYLTYAVQKQPGRDVDFVAKNVEHTPTGLVIYAETPEGLVTLRSPLVGAYNASNILAAVAASHALGVGPAAWTLGVAAVRGIPGRMERIVGGQPYTAIVDFAHTPNALEHALSAARELVDDGGRVIAVFGCAGLRDPSKRAPMGQAAGRLADVSIITAEDPRTEDLDAIIEAVTVGMREAGVVEGEVAEGDGVVAPAFERVPDRGAAIERACAIAGPGDLVIVCGKGHEQSMCFGETEHPWDDREALRAAVRREDLPRRLPTRDSI